MTKKQTVSFLVLTILIILQIFYSLFVLKIFDFSNGFQISRTILANDHIRQAIQIHQKDAIYLPFRVRPIFFNSFQYVYFGLSNLFGLFNLWSLNLFLNIGLFYLFVNGLSNIYRGHSQQFEKIVVLCLLLVASVFVMISRSVGEDQLFLTFLPIFAWGILKGFKDCNRKIFVLLLVLGFIIKYFAR